MSKSSVSIYSDRPAHDWFSGGLWQARGKGSPADALLRARQSGTVSPGTLELLEKAAVNPAVLSDPQWAGDLYAQGLSRAWVDSLGNFGAFDGMLSSMRRVPLLTSASIIAVGASGALVDEGDWFPLSELEIAGSGRLPVLKIVVGLVFSNDLLMSVDANAVALMRREAQSAVARKTDEAFVDAITTGIDPISAGGADTIRDDLAAALQAVSIGQGSKLWLLARSDIIKHMAMVVDPAGRPTFPGVRVDGGSHVGIEIVPCDAVEEGSMILVDSSGIAAAGGFVGLSTSESAAIRMSDNPSADTTLTDLFGKNMTALKVQRWFSAQRLRDDAVAMIVDANYVGGTA